MKIVDRLLETPCYVIDFLPKPVPKETDGQFFKVEDYLLKHYECYGMKERVICTVLKAMCYYPIAVYWRGWIEQPTPKQIVEIIDTIMEKQSGDMNVLFTSKNALLQFGWDCLNISIYNPDEEMCILFEQIAASEGMFWRKVE